jgi:hypothetical protein
MNIKIEKGIPIPEGRNHLSQWRLRALFYLFRGGI